MKCLAVLCFFSVNIRSLKDEQTIIKPILFPEKCIRFWHQNFQHFTMQSDKC